MSHPLNKDQRYTVTAIQLNHYIMAYSGLTVYTALFLDGRITKNHFAALVSEIEGDLQRRKADLDERVASALAEPRPGQGDSADSE